MARPLTPEQCRARAKALEEAAEHLGLAWTDNLVEREQGDHISRKLQAECGRYRAQANAKEFGNPLLAKKF
ncbi:MAG: hypothetical protein V4713_03915 [Pseudomonadota bacterium]